MTTVAKAHTKPEKGEKGTKISWEDFEKEYLTREDGIKYEWVNGYVEKTKNDINQYQLKILTILQEYFYQLKFSGKVNGHLVSEVDAFFLEKVQRRPDMAWFTQEQIDKAFKGVNQIPAFVIEIISKHDIASNLLNKLRNYNEAKVEVIWLIVLESEEVHVFSKGKQKICTGKQVCSAAPVLPNFKISVNDLFAK